MRTITSACTSHLQCTALKLFHLSLCFLSLFSFCDWEPAAKKSMTPVQHFHTRFPLHINLNKWYWMQPWPLVLLSISTTSAPIYSLLSTPLPMMEWKIHHFNWLLHSAISQWMMVNNRNKKEKKNQLRIILGFHLIHMLTDYGIMRWLSDTDFEAAPIKLGYAVFVPLGFIC